MATSEEERELVSIETVTSQWRAQFPVIVESIESLVRCEWYGVLKRVHGDDVAYQWWLQMETVLRKEMNSSGGN